MALDLIQTDVSDVSKAIAIIGAFVVFVGPISLVIKERLYLSEPLLAVTFGIIVGPIVLGWVDPFSWGSEESIRYLTYQVMRIVLGIQVLFCGVSLPAKYLERNWLSLLTLLGGVMTIAWFICGLLIWGLIPDLTFLESLCLGAAITPTDPVLSNGIASFAHEQLGNIIIAEGGANDGLGFPYLYLPVYLMRRRPDGPDAGSSIGSEVGRWIYSTLVYQILLSTAYGFTVGFVARKTLKWAERRDWVEKNNFFVYSFGLAFFCLGTCGMIGSDDILSCFIAGNSFTHDDWFRLRTLENDTQEILDLLLNLIVFIYAGAIIPFDSYSSENKLEPWRVIVLAICVLLVRRLPWVVLLKRWIPAVGNLKDAAFCGWFGPIGVSAVYYIEVALRELPESRTRLREVYGPVVLFMVLSSVVVHGISIPMIEFIPRARDFTKTRSLTFTQPSQTFVGAIERQNDAAAASPNSDKLLWNPIHEAYMKAKPVVLFWQPDSFWRYPKPAEPARGIDKGTIADPQDARAQTTVPDRHLFPTVSSADKLDKQAADPRPREGSTVAFALDTDHTHAHAHAQGSSSKLDAVRASTTDAGPPEEDITRASTPEEDSDPESLGAETDGMEGCRDRNNRGKGRASSSTSTARPPPPALVLPK